MKELSIKQNMIWNSIGSITNLTCHWLITILIVRLSGGYAAAGVYSLAMAVYGIFAPIAHYRMYTYQISDVKKENTTGEYFAFRCLTTGGALIACMVYSFFTCSQDAWAAIFLYGLFKTASFLIDVLHACNQMHHRMDFIGKSLIAQGVVSLFLFVVIFGVTGNLELTLVVMTVGVVLVGILYDFPRTSTFTEIKLGISRNKAISLFMVCLPFVVAGLAASATPSLPRQYLSFAFGAEALGAYASVAAPVAIIQMGASYVYGPLLSYFSEYYANRDRYGFCKMLALSSLAIAGIGVACVAGFYLMGEELLALVFGDAIRAYVYLLIPLTALAVITGYLWFINDLLITMRDFKGTVVGSFVPLGVVVMAMVPLVDLYGMNGATYAGIAASISGIVVMVVFMSIRMKKHFQ